MFGMLDLGQEAPLGERSGHRIVVAAVEQSLEHHPALGDVVVPGQVDPAHAAVGQASDDLVLAARPGRRPRASERTRSGRRNCGRTPRDARARRRASARRALRSAHRSAVPRRPPDSRARRCQGRDTASPGSRPGRRRDACGRPCAVCRSGAPMSCRCARAACSWQHSAPRRARPRCRRSPRARLLPTRCRPLRRPAGAGAPCPQTSQ